MKSKDDLSVPPNSSKDSYCKNQYFTVKSNQPHRAEELTQKRDIGLDITGASVRYNSLVTTKTEHTGEISHSQVKMYTCNVCSAAFSSSGYLRVHMKTHSGIRLFKCDVCAKSFKQSHVLKEHKKRHSEMRLYKCDVCQKTFKTSNDLYKHKEKTHSEERPYKCNICSKTFISSYYLSRHKKVHSDNRRYNSYVYI